MKSFIYRFNTIFLFFLLSTYSGDNTASLAVQTATDQIQFTNQKFEFLTSLYDLYQVKGSFF